jgi:hypothetical protein
VEYNLDVESNDEEDTYESCRLPVEGLLDSYLLGERSMNLTYQNAVLKAIFDCYKAGHACPNTPAIGRVYKGTPASSLSGSW